MPTPSIKETISAHDEGEDLPRMGGEDIRKLIASAPDHIWLDLGENLESLSDDATFRDLREVTWSEDNASGWGIPYVRSDLTSSPEAAPAAMAGDRSDAVNLARNMLEVRNCKGITSYGVRVLSEAVMAMDAALVTPPAATPAAPSAAPAEELVVAAKEAVRWLNSWFRNHDGNKIADALSAALAQPAPVQPASATAGGGSLLENIEYPNGIPASQVPKIAAPVQVGAQQAAALPAEASDAMCEAAMEAHYGVRRVRACGGARGIDMTVDDNGYNGLQAFRRMWRGAIRALAAPTQAGKTTAPVQQDAPAPSVVGDAKGGA
ncbi:hypothetical protein CY658_04815 [Variovorax sp. RO1]|uniref:hypothetical protein n=1 Tax=Variovorax sp. RO1 TaxID=2066034 RepID=UPI000C716450|nr:hypothetical protein [Variovorax sp. RO1]PLC06358.1 hypothetical protein CY658_04815 [Variovorax sp. RO1]